MRLHELLDQIDEQSYELLGDKEFETLALAQAGIHTPFLTFLDTVQYIDTISPFASIALTTREIAPELRKRGVDAAVVEEPRLLFFRLHNMLAQDERYTRSLKQTVISPSARISPLASIAEKGVVIGPGVIVEEFVTIRSHVSVGEGSILRAGCVVGGNGFEFKRKEGGILPVEHCGGVQIGKQVEIQYNTCIDRAVYPWDDTVIGDYCKVDNLVHIGHAVKINARTMVVALSGVGGRTEIDADSWVGFGATIRNGLKIEDHCRVNMGAVVTKDIPAGQAVSGNFAIEHSRFIDKLKSGE